MKRTTSRFIALFGMCFLLFNFAKPTIAWPPPCPGCCYWDGWTCWPDNSACPACNSCISCECEWDCIAGATCCNGSCCDSGNCCNSTTCCPNSDDVCCTDSGSYCCESGKTCCQGTCCESDKCCDDGTCVPKCTNTSQCDYGELPSGPYPNCQVLKDDSTGKCNGAEGLICGHNINIATNDAECADCAPGCAKTRICACAEIIPYRCKTHCYLLFCDCTCDEKYEERTYRGDHYECD